MNREVSAAWRKVASEAMDAACSLTSKNPRGVCNRVYYAAYAHAHSLLLEVGERPRAQHGTWSHDKLPAVIRSALARTMGTQSARKLAQLVERVRKHRVAADYEPTAVIGEADSLRLIGAVRLALEGRT